MADSDLFDDDDEGWDPFADAGSAGDGCGDRGDQGDGRRPRGRPKGSLNRKTADFDRWYQAKGFRDPLTAMAQYLTADPVQLQRWFAEHDQAKVAVGKKIMNALPTLMDILKEQHACASQLAPYLHGKKPVQLEIIDERLPSLIIDLGTNQLEEGLAIAGRKALSVGEKPSEINDGDEPVTRQPVTRDSQGIDNMEERDVEHDD